MRVFVVRLKSGDLGTPQTPLLATQTPLLAPQTPFLTT